MPSNTLLNLDTSPPDYRRIKEWVWVSGDGEFIREQTARRCWPDSFKDGRAPRVIQRFPLSCEHQSIGTFVTYEVRQFANIKIGEDPPPFTNSLLIQHLKDNYVAPRVWPRVRFYVDPLKVHPLDRVSPEAQAYGRTWCHLFHVNGDKEDLHQFAERLGMKRSWFQNHPILYHYDLTPAKRALAVQYGAVDVRPDEEFETARMIYHTRKLTG